MRTIAMFASLLTGGALAAPAVAEDGDLLAHLPPGSRIEARVDADLTADGRADTAFLGDTGSAYALVVLAARADGSRGVVGRETFEMGGLGPPALRATPKSVLILEELVGGTTATQGTYRYRWDPARGALRLIGLDATFYSRTNAHDAFELSWNLLTGALIARRRALDDAGGGYVDQPEDRSVRRSGPVLLGDTPDAAALVEAELAARSARTGGDRD